MKRNILPAHWLLWCALAVHLPIAVVAARTSMRPHYDIDNFHDIGTKAGRPYRDWQVEFPVATVMSFRALAAAAGGDRERFGVFFVVTTFAADLAIAAALGWGWGIAAAACYTLMTIPIVDLYFLRADLWSTAFATIAIAAWRRDRRIVTAIGLAIGAAFKLWPLAFLPLLLVPSSRGGLKARVGPIAAAAAAGMAVLGGWLWIAGPSGLYQVLTFRGATGWEIESTVGSVWMLIDQGTMRVENGAWRIGSTIGPISMLLFALAAVPCLWTIWRGARTGHLGTGWAGGISALLFLSALLSPQFAAWISPASGAAWVEGDRRIAVLTTIAVFLTNLVWKSFNPLVHGATTPLVMLLARNALLAWVAFDAARLVARARPAETAAQL